MSSSYSYFPFLELPRELQVEVFKHYFPLNFDCQVLTDRYKAEPFSWEKKLRSAGQEDEICLLWTSPDLREQAECALLACFSREAVFSIDIDTCFCVPLWDCFEDEGNSTILKSLPPGHIRVISLENCVWMDHDLRDEDLQLYELFDEHWSRLVKILPISKKLSRLEEVRIGIEERIEDVVEEGDKKTCQDFIDGRKDVILKAWLADTFLKKQPSDLGRMKRLDGKSIAFEIGVSWIVGSSVDNQQYLHVVFRIENIRKVHVARRTVTLREYSRTVGEMTSSDDSEAA